MRSPSRIVGVVRPLAAGVAVGAVLMASGALAQTGVGVSPGRSELTSNAGAVLTQELAVDNPSRTTVLDVSVYLSDVLLGPDGSMLYLEAGMNPRSLAPWTSVNPLLFTLQPGAAERVAYTITVPPDAASGTYWGIIFFESRPRVEEAETQGIGVTTLVRVGHTVYVTVGEASRQGAIAGIRFDDVTPPGVIRVTFQNSGDALIRLDGRIEIRSTTGELVQVLSIDDAPSFPGATHDLVVPISEPITSGEYIVLAVLDTGGTTVIAGEGQVKVP